MTALPPIRSLMVPFSAGLLAAAAVLTGPPAEGKAKALYTLDTKCSLGANEAVDCSVEAVESEAATLYRHAIGDRTITIRISDEPTRTTWIEGTEGEPRFLNSAGAQFSSNTICYDGRELCVVNPNYLNSIREELPAVLEGRDLVRVMFAADGRVALTCYDDACQEVNW